MNPTLYFSISKTKDGKGYLHPARNNKQLSQKFNDIEIQNINITFYNKYTADFIKSHIQSNDFFWSNEYEYDPDILTFNFYKLNPCMDDDYEKMQYPSNFDITKKYNLDTHKEQTILDTIKEKYPYPDISTGFYVEEKNWNYLVRNIMQHKNTMLI